jgi:outer membrane protein assembly complex protein YaeT
MKQSRRKLIAVIAGTVILIAIIAMVLLHTPAANRYALGILQDLLRRDYGIELKASRVRYNVLRLSVRLEQITLGATAAPDLPPFLQVARAELRLSLPSLLAGIPAINTARLDGVKLHYLVTEDGRSNLPRDPKAKPFEELPDFLIADLESPAGSLLFEDRQSQLTINIPRWKLGVRGNPAPLAHRIVFEAEQAGTAAYRGKVLPVEKFELTANVKKKDLALEALHLRLGDSELSGSGSLEDFAKPSLNFSVEPDLDLGRLAELAEIGLKTAGRVRGKTSVTGRLDDIQISGDIEGDGIAAAGYTQIGFNARAHWSSKAEQLQLDAFSARSPKGQVEGKGELALNPTGGSRLDARIQDLDLEPAMRHFALPVQVASRASGNVRAQWKGLDFSSLSADSRFSLVPARSTPGPNVLPLAATGSLKSTTDRIAVSIESAHLLSSSVSGQVVIRSLERIEGELRGHVEQVEQLMAEVSNFLGRNPDQPLAGVDLKGSADLTARLQGRLENPTVIGSLETQNLAVGGIEGASLKAAVEITRSGIVLREAVAQLNDQKVYAEGFIGLEGSSPPLKIDARVEQGSIAALLSALQIEIPAEGNFQGEAHIGGRMTHLTGEVTLSGSELKLYGEPLGTLTAGIRLEGQKLETTRFLLDKTPGDATENFIEGKAEYDIGSGQFSFDATGKNLNLENLKLPDETPVTGQVNLSASGTGTFDSPAVDLKLQATNVEIRRQLVGTLDATAALKNQQALIEVRAPRLNMASNARIETRAPYPVEFELKASDSDLSLLAVPIGPGQTLAGSIDATINGSGTLNAIKQVALSAEIGKIRLAALDREVRNQAPIKLAYRDGAVRIDPAIIVSNNVEIEVAGAVPLEEQAGRGSLSVKGFLDLAEVFPFIDEPEGLYAAGRVNLNLVLEGTLRRMGLAGGITLTEGFFHYPYIRMPLTDIILDLKIENDMLLLTQAQGVWGSGKLSLSGEMPLELVAAQLPFEIEKNGKAARLALALRDLRLETLGGEFPSGMTGVVDLQVSAEAPRLDLQSLSAKATFERLRLQIEQYVLEQAEPSTIVVRDGVAAIERFALTGPRTKVQASGTAGLGGDLPLDLRVNGNFDAGILTFMSEQIRAAGETRLELALAGTANAPLFSGFLELQDGKATLANPRIDADDLDVRLKFAADSLAIENLTGQINGGSLQGRGSVGYREGQVADFNIDLKAENMFLDVPKGLRTLASANLQVRSPEQWIEIVGKVLILEGSYRDPLLIDSELLNSLKAGQTADLGGEPSPLLSRIRYNVSLETKTPILVDNNLAKLAADANIRLVGTFYRPALVGRMTVEEGGEVYLNERKYLVERGNIDFTSETRIEPSLDIQAKAEVANYDIDLHISGPPTKVTTTLTSEPPLPEPDIISLLLTGRTLDAVHGQEFEVAKEQVLSYLAGSAGQRISAGAQRALGFSEVRIEPSLISPESEPGARLTVGQDVTPDFRLIYSMDLVDSGKQTYIVEYDLTRRFTTRGIKDDENDYRFEFNHELRLGGSRQRTDVRRSQPKTRVGSLKFAGDSIFPEKTLSDKLGVKPGDKYDFFKLRKGTDKLQNFYAKQGHLEALIRLERQPRNGETDLTLQIQPGPQVEFVFEGAEVSGDVKERVRQIWSEGAFDAQRAEDALKVIRKPLVEEGYLQSSVNYSIEELPDRKRVRFSISPGTRFTNVDLLFTGASGIDAAELKRQLEKADLRTSVNTEPRQVEDFLKRLYQKRGYLQSEVEPPRLEPGPQAGSGEMIIAIKEGPLFKVGDLNFSGQRHFSIERLLQAIPLATGKEYRSQLMDESITKLEQLYRSNGFNEVIISYRITRDQDAALANVFFEIEEHRQGVIREIVIEGNDRTSDGFVRRQLSIAQGDLLDLDKIGRSRTSLYNTGVFTIVDFQTEEIAEPGIDSSSEIKPVRIRVKLSEVTPYRFRYGASYDTDRGPGVTADLARRNFLGKAAVLGVITRYDSKLKEVRGYFGQPSVIGIPVRTNLTTFFTREVEPTFITDSIGFSLQQQKRFKNRFLLEYGYRYERAKSFDKIPDPVFPEPISLPLARLFTTLTQDTRDDLLDATRGSFISHGLEWATEKLGSDFRFLKYYGQYFYYRPLRKPDEAGNGISRPRLVYAVGVRGGLAKTFADEFLIREERYFSGGGTTVRGFEQDRLGPVDLRGEPLGGEAVFILNNELRFPMVSIFDGVGFVDLGNVYLKASDFNPFDVRKTAGMGIRLRTSWLLLRLDYGFKLDRKQGESRGALFFSIGQAF